MDTFVVLLLVGAVILFLVTRSQRQRSSGELESLDAVKTVAEEDVTRLGEDVALLDTDTAGREMDEATRQDYRRALDAYDSAKAALDRVRGPDDVRAVTGILEDGRYAIACVQARLAGEPLPRAPAAVLLQPPARPLHRRRRVGPAGWCSAARFPPAGPTPMRVIAGAEPDIRKVPVGAGRRPYWQGGQGYQPYAQGYFSPFAGSGLLPGVLLGAVMFGGFGGWDGDGSDGGSDGGDAGGDGGGGDGGGDGGGTTAAGTSAAVATAAAGATGDGGGGDFGGGFGGGDF